MALLQLATRDECFLFRLNHLSLPDYLQRLLASPHSIKIGVALRDDIRALRRLNEFNPQGFVDLSEVGRQLGIVTVGLRNLAAILLKVRISKKAQLSNWERPKLDTTQQSYAATDAWICVEMLHYLQSQSTEPTVQQLGTLSTNKDGREQIVLKNKMIYLTGLQTH
mgnify:CR=1 FL=1